MLVQCLHHKYREILLLRTPKRSSQGAGLFHLPPQPLEGKRKNIGKRSKVGKNWYKKYTKASYFSNVCVDWDNKACEFPHILRRMQEIRIGFAFDELEECNLSMVCEFYAN